MTLEQVLAEMKKGATSLVTAKQLLGENLTPETAAVVTKAHEQMMRGVYNHQATMRRVMARSY